jgi:hypothetical protein
MTCTIYVGRMRCCGAAVAVVAAIEGHEKSTGEEVGDMIARGLVVSSMPEDEYRKSVKLRRCQCGGRKA